MMLIALISMLATISNATFWSDCPGITDLNKYNKYKDLFQDIINSCCFNSTLKQINDSTCCRYQIINDHPKYINIKESCFLKAQIPNVVASRIGRILESIFVIIVIVIIYINRSHFTK